jgi:hypothetical protein
MNKRSPRAGLLTFEHQGCPQFEDGPRHLEPGIGIACVKTIEVVWRFLSEEQIPKALVNLTNQ